MIEDTGDNGGRKSIRSHLSYLKNTNTFHRQSNREDKKRKHLFAKALGLNEKENKNNKIFNGISINSSLKRQNLQSVTSLASNFKFNSNSKSKNSSQIQTNLYSELRSSVLKPDKRFHIFNDNDNNLPSVDVVLSNSDIRNRRAENKHRSSDKLTTVIPKRSIVTNLHGDGALTKQAKSFVEAIYISNSIMNHQPVIEESSKNLKSLNANTYYLVKEVQKFNEFLSVVSIVSNTDIQNEKIVALAQFQPVINTTLKIDSKILLGSQRYRIVINGANIFVYYRWQKVIEFTKT
ncbi:unnamed protein product [[Candida] boidinii]|nr:unnamed protein product [[Candida] boidinii]